MGSHINKDGEFQSDKYPSCPPGKVPLSVHDKTAQDLLVEYARRRRRVDVEFSDDLLAAIAAAGCDRLVGARRQDWGDEVFFYEADCYCLSNFSSFRLRWSGIDFDTSEHAYHWEKFPDCPEARLQIQHARSAHEAFKLARAVWPTRVRPDWPEVRVDVMRQILHAKVTQHAYVRRKLLGTGDRLLIEDSWRDDVWGWGESGGGQNLLGLLWMGVRAEIRAACAGSCDGNHGGGVCASPQCWHACPLCGDASGECEHDGLDENSPPSGSVGPG